MAQRTPNVHLCGPKRFKHHPKFYEEDRKKEGNFVRERETKREMLALQPFLLGPTWALTGVGPSLSVTPTHL